MEENKNLTPEPEETVAEEAVEEAAEEAAEEKVEEVAEETTEEVVEEVAEEATEETVEEVAEEAAPKKAKGGKIAAIIAACLSVVIIIALAAMFFLKTPSVTEGTGNFYSYGFASVKDNEVYHVNFADYKMYKTNIDSGESVVASEDESAMYINNYKGDIYYVGITIDTEAQKTVYKYKKYVDGKNDIVILEEAPGGAQISDGYIYYIKSVPEFYSGYSNRVYRAPIVENATPEMVCDVLCNSFYVEGDMLYYGDVETTSFMKVSIEDAMKAIKEAPLAEGGKRTSAEIGAETVVTSAVVGFPTIYKDVLYYIDSLNQGEFRAFDLKTGEDHSFNTGIFATKFNIYGDYIYYCNQTDFCIYRMNLDGSDVLKVTAPGSGENFISNDKFISIEISEKGYPYISVCDLDGNVIRTISFDEQFDELYAAYEDIAEEAPDEGTEENSDEEEATEETTEETIETTVDMEE